MCELWTYSGLTEMADILQLTLSRVIQKEQPLIDLLDWAMWVTKIKALTVYPWDRFRSYHVTRACHVKLIITVTP